MKQKHNLRQVETLFTSFNKVMQKKTWKKSWHVSWPGLYKKNLLVQTQPSIQKGWKNVPFDLCFSLILLVTVWTPSKCGQMPPSKAKQNWILLMMPLPVHRHGCRATVGRLLTVSPLFFLFPSLLITTVSLSNLTTCSSINTRSFVRYSRTI